MITHKVYVLGIDGGSFVLLGRWLQQGKLPHLQAIITNGISGELRSSLPPVTAPAWTSFMTGKNPGKHGVYDFMLPARQSYTYYPISAHTRCGKALWEIISEAGGRVAVLNVPTTYPPRAVNGVLISDFLTPSGKRDFTYPQSLLEELEGTFGPYPLYVVPPIFAATQVDADIAAFVDEYRYALEYKFQVAHYLIDKIDPHFLMLHIYGNDQISHWLWHLLDQNHPLFQPERHEKYAGKIFEYFARLDHEVGRLRARIDENTTLIIMSDHGFGPIKGNFNVNNWLLSEGYLVIKDTFISKVRLFLWKLGLTPEFIFNHIILRFGILSLFSKRKTFRSKGTNLVDELKKIANSGRSMLLSFADVDWSKTKAFSFFGFGHININLRGKYPQGCVEPGEEYARLREEIVDKLRALKDPQAGKPLNSQIFTSEAIYHGENFHTAPDITFLPLADSYVPRSVGKFLSNRHFSDIWGVTAAHRMEGILLGIGKGLRTGVRVQGARIIDVAPSILYLMGMPIPKDMDGVLLRDMFTPEFLAQMPLQYVDPPATDNRSSVALSTEDDADIVAKLQALGYLD